MAEDQQEISLVIDCVTGQGYEMVLDEPEELAQIAAMREQARAERAAEARRHRALERLRGRACADPLVNDLLTALGLD